MSNKMRLILGITGAVMIGVGGGILAIRKKHERDCKAYAELYIRLCNTLHEVCDPMLVISEDDWLNSSEEFRKEHSEFKKAYMKLGPNPKSEDINKVIEMGCKLHRYF